MPEDKDDKITEKTMQQEEAAPSGESQEHKEPNGHLVQTTDKDNEEKRISEDAGSVHAVIRGEYEPPVEYDSGANIVTIHPGASLEDLKGISDLISDGCTVALDSRGATNAAPRTIAVSPSLLSCIGDKATELTIGRGVSVEYMETGDGDIWNSLPQLRRVSIYNNIGVPANADGTGAFQEHGNLRCVDMALDAEGTISKGFCRGTALSTLMVHSAVPGSEYGLVAEDDVLFGSTLKSEKGLSYRDWNRIHGRQMASTHRDDSYLESIGSLTGMMDQIATNLETDGFEAMKAVPYLMPLAEEAARRIRPKKDVVKYDAKIDCILHDAEGVFDPKTLEVLKLDILSKVRDIVDEMKASFSKDPVGTYIEMGFSRECIDSLMEEDSFQHRKDFKESVETALFRQKVRLDEAERDYSCSQSLLDRLSGTAKRFERLMEEKTADTERNESNKALVVSKLNTMDRARSWDIVIHPDKDTDPRVYADAVKDMGKAIGESGLDDVAAKKAMRDLKDMADSFGASFSAKVRGDAFSRIATDHSMSDGTYVELPSALSVGDNFLSCRRLDIHSATDPENRTFTKEVGDFAQKTVDSIYARCLEIENEFVRIGIREALRVENGRAVAKSTRNYKSIMAQPNPISAFNSAFPKTKIDRESCLEGGRERYVRKVRKDYEGLRPAQINSQLKAFLDFVSKTSREKPSKERIGEIAREMDEAFSRIATMGDAAFSELRKAFPSIEIDAKGHVLDLQQAMLMDDSKNVLVLNEGSKMGDNCLCFTDCRGVAVGRMKNEYRHFRSWAENRYVEAKEKADRMKKTLLKVEAGSPDDRDVGNCGAYANDIEDQISRLEAKARGQKPLTEEDRRLGKTDWSEVLSQWKVFRRSYMEYSEARAVWEANDTEEKWRANRSYALKDVDGRIAEFERIHANSKTKDLRTKKDVMTMVYDQLSAENKKAYDALVEERNEILKDPSKVKTGMHFLSEGKDMGTDCILLAGSGIDAGRGSFANNPLTLEVHGLKPETEIGVDVVEKDLYERSDIFRGRMLMGKQHLSKVFDTRNFRFMRLEEALLDMVVNIFKTLFNLTSAFVEEAERRARRYMTEKGIYQQREDEARSLLLMCQGKEGEVFLEKLMDKDSPSSEYNAAARVIGRLKLESLAVKDESKLEKIARLRSYAERSLAKARMQKDMAHERNRADQEAKKQREDLYRTIGRMSRSVGVARASKELGAAKAQADWRLNKGM